MRGWSRSHWNYLTFDAGESSSPVLMFLSIRTTAFSLTNIFFSKKNYLLPMRASRTCKEISRVFCKKCQNNYYIFYWIREKEFLSSRQKRPASSLRRKKNSPCLLDGYESCWSLFRPSDLQYTVWHNIFFILPRKFRHKWIILLFWSQTFTFFWNKL